MCASAGCVDDMVALARTPDPLLQMAALGLLVGLSYSTQGMEYFFARGVAGWLLQLAGVPDCGGAEAGEADMYLGPDALEVLAAIFTNAAATGVIPIGGSASASSSASANGTAHLSTQYRDTIISFTKAILSAVGDSSASHASSASNIKFAALHSLAIFTVSSQTALCLVLENDELVGLWCELLKSTRSDLVGAVLMSIAHVLAARVDAGTGLGAGEGGSDATVFTAAAAGEDEEQVKVLKTKLLLAIGAAKVKSAPVYLLSCAQQPLVEIKHGACRVLAALARHTWGLNLLFSGENAAVGSPIWVFLHDYHHVDGKAQKEWKYEVLCAIANSRGFGHLRSDVQGFVRKRVEQGAYFVPAEMEDPMVL